MRVLPDWLSHPTIVEHDLTHNQIAVDDYPLISTKIAAALKQNNISHLFPGKFLFFIVDKFMELRKLHFLHQV